VKRRAVESVDFERLRVCPSADHLDDVEIDSRFSHDSRN
jgi:hypothetical protein